MIMKLSFIFSSFKLSCVTFVYAQKKEIVQFECKCFQSVHLFDSKIFHTLFGYTSAKQKPSNDK